ncbi:FmdB family transcriptional regulator [Blastococcus sp. MG754426]|uniref:FmdB family zinc ribbon protein n=1 Tax=unclassified Blastococcus TaxID=2619396 RepID=UPI001EF074BA|nr:MULTISPECIES: FmdB family zinc ribbon protein [unclassified Blastococcus]MCF6506098.1 FmdB family transcriptional regulator [Blastococcus sp. MG754426]MCF6510524.1 FmdB family transcriptional regulator [Blastococcus sp. MG754427]MCF6734635.1 FmdB family transcriptional regulator [Blastococcus sp. KM273129]
MPTYQYACANAEGKHEFEVVQSFTDAPVTECPECGAAVRKVYGSVGVVFKGSGFYRTDSRSTGKTSEKAGSNGSSGTSSTPAKESSSPAPAATPAATSGSAAKAAN